MLVDRAHADRGNDQISQLTQITNDGLRHVADRMVVVGLTQTTRAPPTSVLARSGVRWWCVAAVRWHALCVVLAPTLTGVIERRLLVNFTIDAEVAAGFLPTPFEPQLVGGRAVAGVCLIRLAGLRPRGLPSWAGVRSENAAHRVAVVRTDHPEVGAAVFIPRRDTNSILSTWVGGSLFPGVHHRADFETVTSDRHYEVAFRSRDGAVSVDVSGDVAADVPARSVFESVEASSEFFSRGSIGWSATSTAGCFDGLELRTDHWSVHAFDVGRVRSTFFDDTTVFPSGSVRFDHALIMRNVNHTWHPLDQLDQRAAVDTRTDEHAALVATPSV